MRRYILFFALFFTAKAVFAFQFADGTSGNKPPGIKYIFYWGNYQCDLTQANGYKGQLTVSLSGFRQILLHPPNIWNGSSLLRDFSFKLEGISISTPAYASRLGELDAALGPQTTAGKVFHITELGLGDGLTGFVDIQLKEDEDKKDILPVRGNWSSTAPFLNEQLLQSVAWGREDITRMSDRDFFTVSEFWQTVRQQPYLEWQPYAAAGTIRVSINFQGPEQGPFVLTTVLTDDDAYRQMLDNLNNYKHLARPGATISLELQTAERYEQLYKKQMTLVPDSDSRLLLRRKRDTRVVEISWGAFVANLGGLYLSTFTQADGKTAPIDGPVSRFAMVTYADALQSSMVKQPLVCRIDGESRSGLSCRATFLDKTFELKAGESFPDTLAAAILVNCDAKNPLQLDSFVLAGVDLPPMHFLVHFASFGNLSLVPNEFEVLQKTAAMYTLAKLFQPVVTEDSMQIRFQLPKKAFCQISIFEPNGNLVHLTEGKYAAEEQLVKIPREGIKAGSKYFVFLNTPFGVAKAEMEMK